MKQQETLSSISCKLCNRIHKKCRGLPSCQRCLDRGVECIYGSTNSERLGTHRTNPLGTEQETRIIKKNTIQTYCDIICVGSPSFETSELEQMMFTDVQELCTEKKDIFALLLSIQVLCEQRFAYVDLAKNSESLCKQVLSNIYDDTDNQYVALTYLHLAFYYVSNGDKKKSRCYLSFFNNFVRELTIYADGRNLQDALRIRQHEMGSNIVAKLKNMHLFKAVTELIASPLSPLPNSDVISDAFNKIIGISLPEELLKTASIGQDKSLKEQLLANESIYNLLYSYVKDSVKSNYALQFHEYYRRIWMNGMRIFSILMTDFKNETKENEKAWRILLEQSALNLTECTQNEMLPFISPFMVPFFIIGSNLNLEIAKSIDCGERENMLPYPVFDQINSIENVNELYNIDIASKSVNYFEVISKDARALGILSTRYKFIQPYEENINALLQQRFSSTGRLDTVLNEAAPQTSERVTNYFKQMREFLVKYNSNLGAMLKEEPNCESYDFDEDMDPFLKHDIDLDELINYYFGE